MARHTREEKNTESEISRKQKDVFEQFFGLSAAMVKHVEDSMQAVQVCRHCSKSKEGVHVPGTATNGYDRCAFCDGSYLVPDKDQRNWATEIIVTRAAPAPKAVDMNITDATKENDIRELTEDLSNEQLTLLAQAFKMSNDSNGNNANNGQGKSS